MACWPGKHEFEGQQAMGQWNFKEQKNSARPPSERARACGAQQARKVRNTSNNHHRHHHTHHHPTTAPLPDWGNSRCPKTDAVHCSLQLKSIVSSILPSICVGEVQVRVRAASWCWSGCRAWRSPCGGPGGVHVRGRAGPREGRAVSMRGAFAETRCGAECLGQVWGKGPGALPGGVQARSQTGSGCEAGRAWAPPDPAPRGKYHLGGSD